MTDRSQILVYATALVLWLAPAIDSRSSQLRAQEPGLRCPAATADADTVLRQLDRIAAGELMLGQSTSSSAAQIAVWRPFADTGCPVLRDGIERREVMIRILRYAMDHDDDRIAGPVMKYASATAYYRAGELGWTPTEMLFEAVSSAATPAARWQALLRLVNEATDPEIRARLIALVRQPAGPPGWRNLPADLVRHLEFMPQAGARLLEAALQDRPDHVRHPLARWRLECGRGHAPPRPPGDPCHPSNAPPPIPAAGTPAGLRAQDVDGTAMRAALASVRNTGSPSKAAAFLSQEAGPRSAGALQALTDSLIAIAISYRRGDPPRTRRAAHAATLALLLPAHPGHLAERAQARAESGAGRVPVAYPRALDALVQVFRNSSDPGIQGATLYFVTQLPDTHGVVSFLAEVAASPTARAATAIRHLSTEMGDAGLRILRRLYETGAVVDPTAAEHLEVLASSHGWSR